MLFFEPLRPTLAQAARDFELIKPSLASRYINSLRALFTRGVKSHDFSLNGLHLSYYEAYEEEYHDEENGWQPFGPEPSFETNVQSPEDKRLEGFNEPPSPSIRRPGSPLSCNCLAENVLINPHCLFNTFTEAKSGSTGAYLQARSPGFHTASSRCSVLRAFSSQCKIDRV